MIKRLEIFPPLLLITRCEAHPASAVFLLGLAIDFFDNTSWDTSYHNIFWNILSDDGSCCNNRTATDLNTFDNYSVSTDENIVTDTDRFSTSWLDNACKNSTCTNVAIFTDNSASAQNSSPYQS